MARALEAVLATWRDAERVLEELPTDAPERRPVQLEVARLRRTYRRLTDQKIPRTADHIKVSLDSVERARLTIARARERIEVGSTHLAAPPPSELVPE